MDQRWTVDRLEGDLAVVEIGDKRFLDLPRWMLPDDAGEGAHLLVRSRSGRNGARVLELTVDHGATQAARQEVHATLERLRGRDSGGDIEL
jgi:hypothetical protein